MKINNLLTVFIAISVAISSSAFASDELATNDEAQVVSETQTNLTDNSQLALNQDTNNDTSFKEQTSSENDSTTKDKSSFWDKLKKKNHTNTKGKNASTKKSKPKKSKNSAQNNDS
jgi:hypothetical protein